MFCMIAPALIPGVLSGQPGLLSGLPAHFGPVRVHSNSSTISEHEIILRHAPDQALPRAMNGMTDTNQQKEVGRRVRDAVRRTRAGKQIKPDVTSQAIMDVRQGTSLSSPQRSSSGGKTSPTLLTSNAFGQIESPPKADPSLEFAYSVTASGVIGPKNCFRPNLRYHCNVSPNTNAKSQISNSNHPHCGALISRGNDFNSVQNKISTFEHILSNVTSSDPSKCCGSDPEQQHQHAKRTDLVKHTLGCKKTKRGLVKPQLSWRNEKAMDVFKTNSQKAKDTYVDLNLKVTSKSSSTPHHQNAKIQNQKAESEENARATQSSNSTKKTFLETYDVHGVIGVGGGGMVYAGTRTADSQPVAIKRIMREKVKRWERLQGRTIPQEIALMIKVNGHRGIIRLLDWYECLDSFILILERPKNSIDLFDYIREIGRMNEKEACLLFKQIVTAVYHIHLRGVVHRDIKDENIVLNRDTGESKLIDFGCGTYLHDHPYTDFSGTPEFYPPEWFNEHYYNARTAAVWSLGVLLFDMLCGEIPFKSKTKIAQGQYEFKVAISQEAQHLINWMLSAKPDARPTLINIMQHPWVTGKHLS